MSVSSSENPHVDKNPGWSHKHAKLNTIIARTHSNGVTRKSTIIVLVIGAALALTLFFTLILLRCSRRRRRHQGLFHQGKARRHTPTFELQPAKRGFTKPLSPAKYDGAGSSVQTALDRKPAEAFRQATDSATASRQTTSARPTGVDDREATTMPAGSSTARPLTALQKGKGRMYPQPNSDYPPGFDGASDAQLEEELNNAIAAAAALKQATLNSLGLGPSDQEISVAADSTAPQGPLQHLATANKQQASRGARHFSFTTKAKDEHLDVVAPAPPVPASERQRLSSGYEAEDEGLDTATLGEGTGSLETGSISTGSRISSTSSVSRRGWRHAGEELHVPPPPGVSDSQASLRGGQVAPRPEITPMGKFGQTGPKWRSGVSSTPELSKVVKQPVHGMPSRSLKKKKGSVGEMSRPAYYDGVACSEADSGGGGGELSVPRKRPFSQRGSREGDPIDAAEAKGKWVEDEFGEHYWVEDEIALRRSRDMLGSEDSGYGTAHGGQEDEGEGEGKWEDAREVFTLDDLPSAQFKVGG